MAGLGRPGRSGEAHAGPSRAGLQEGDRCTASTTQSRSARLRTPQNDFHHGALCGSLGLYQHGGTSMFEEIFFPRTAERYRAAPLVEQRERYLVHLRETGARRSALRKCANDQLSLVRLLVRGAKVVAVRASGLWRG